MQFNVKSLGVSRNNWIGGVEAYGADQEQLHSQHNSTILKELLLRTDDPNHR